MYLTRILKVNILRVYKHLFLLIPRKYHNISHMFCILVCKLFITFILYAYMCFCVCYYTDDILRLGKVLWEHIKYTQHRTVT
jgi:hypothetical protein